MQKTQSPLLVDWWLAVAQVFIEQQDNSAMRNGVPVVPAPPPELPPVEPIGSPGDVEGGRGQIGQNGSSKDQKDHNTRSAKSLRLGGLELSSEDEADDNCHNLIRKLCAMKVTWVIATLFTIVLCGALSGPVVCKDLVSCNQSHHKDQDLRLYSALIAAALVAVLLQEAAAVALTHNTARKAIHLIPNIKESLLPSVLLCVTFVVLLFENLAMVIGDVPWFAHAANLNRSDLHEQPVYTIFYAEWVVNVPILLVMAGSISLGRSAVEVGEPLLITNIYIVLAWVAHFIPNVPLRYTVVSVTWNWFVNFFVSPPGFKWCSVFDMLDFWISVSHASFALFCQNALRTLFNWDVFWEYPGTLNNYTYFFMDVCWNNTLPQ